jgi:hypothetical protein
MSEVRRCERCGDQLPCQLGLCRGAYEQGQAAERNGLGRGANPYPRGRMLNPYRLWDTGWCDSMVAGVEFERIGDQREHF